MKPVIVVFTRYYLPGHLAGGPIRTIAHMVERLGDEFEFRIVCLDRDLGSERSYPGVNHDGWVMQGKAMVRYISPHGFNLRAAMRMLEQVPHDAVYLNSFFDPRFTVQVLVARRWRRGFCRPVVLAPRGEFSPSALQIKQLKKAAFIWMAKQIGLYKGVIWQASSRHEADDISRVLSTRWTRLVPAAARGICPVIAPDLAAPSHHDRSQVRLASWGRSEGVLCIATLARISPIKNLDFSLRVLAAVRVPVRFVIYGPIEDINYWAECRLLIEQLPPNIDVVQYGPLAASAVVAELARYDLFLLPTRGENFGHVIHEALQAGLPVLISDQTPWRRLGEQGVGWDLPLDDMSGFIRRIEEVARWSAEERATCNARARALAIRVSDDPIVLEANRRLFLDAMAWSGPVRQARGNRRS